MNLIVGRDRNLRSDEVLDTPITLGEDSEAVEDDNDEEEKEGSVCRVRLESAPEYHVFPTIDTLGLARCFEAQVGNED